MFRKLMIAGAALAALTAPSLAAPSLAASNWYVFQYGDQSQGCYVAPRAKLSGDELMLAGPFGSQAKGKAAAAAITDCTVSRD